MRDGQLARHLEKASRAYRTGWCGQSSGRPTHQEAVCVGRSISGTTRMPRSRAYSTTRRMSALESAHTHGQAAWLAQPCVFRRLDEERRIGRPRPNPVQTQVIRPVPSLFTLLRPYLAHFLPVFFPFFARFHRLAKTVPTSPKPEPWAKKQSCTPSHLLDRISPIFTPFFLDFCASSPSCRDGSNEPQAGTQGQETAGKMAKTRELGPSFDTPGANQRINWRRRLRAGLAPRGQPAQLDRLAQLRPGASAAGHGSRLLQSVAAARGRHGGRDVPAPNGT